MDVSDRKQISYTDVLDKLSDFDSESEADYTCNELSEPKSERKKYSDPNDNFVEYFDSILAEILSVCCVGNCNCCEKIKNVIIRCQQCSNNSLQIQDEDILSNDFDFDSPENYSETNKNKKIRILSDIQVRAPLYQSPQKNEAETDSKAQFNETNLDKLFDELAGITTRFEQPNFNGRLSKKNPGTQNKRKNSIRESTKRTKHPRKAKNLDISYNDKDISLNGTRNSPKHPKNSDRSFVNKDTLNGSLSNEENKWNSVMQILDFNEDKDLNISGELVEGNKTKINLTHSTKGTRHPRRAKNLDISYIDKDTLNGSLIQVSNAVKKQNSVRQMLDFNDDKDISMHTSDKERWKSEQSSLPNLNGDGELVKEDKTEINIRDSTNGTKHPRRAKNLDISYIDTDTLNGNLIQVSNEVKKPNRVRQMLDFNEDKEVSMHIGDEERSKDENCSLPTMNVGGEFMDSTKGTKHPRRSKHMNISYNEKDILTFNPKKSVMGRIIAHRSLPKSNSAGRKANKEQKRKTKQKPVTTPKSTLKENDDNKLCDQTFSKLPTKRFRKLYSPEDWINSQEFEKNLLVND